MDDVFFKKISEEIVSIIKYNDDDFIYKLENQVAKIFLLLVEGVEVSEVKAKLGAPISDETLDQIVKDLVELNVLKEQ
jgi:hypothetical protein